MIQALELSVVRIYGQQGTVIGAGFLVAPQYILTCAHVVAAALGINSDRVMKPTEEIRCDFPIIAPGRFLRTKVEFWLPVKPDSSPEDIASLRLLDSPPERATPAALVAMDGDSSDHSLHALGFPKNRSGGAWADDMVWKGSVALDWQQTVGIRETGYRLEEGFSGTPIWDNDLKGVVGMAVAADKLRPEIKAAFFIPTTLLLKAWDELPKIGQVQGRIPALIKLLQPFHQIFSQEIDWAYKQFCTRISVNFSQELPRSLPELIMSLDNRRENSFTWLEQFVGYLTLRLCNKKDDPSSQLLSQSLERWLKDYQANTQYLINLLKEQRQIAEQEEGKPKTPCLLVRVVETNTGYSVRAWIIKNTEGYNGSEEEACKLLTEEDILTGTKLQDLPRLINLFYQKSLSYCQCEIEKIQVFLPYKKIEKDVEPIDSLVIDQENPYAVPIGAEYEVCIRFSERLNSSNRYSVKWKAKCKILERQQKLEIHKILNLAESSNLAKLYKELLPDDIIATQLTNVPDPSQLEAIMGVLYFAGIPLTVWLRRAVEDHQERFNEMYQGCYLEELSKRVKKERFNASGQQNHIGNYLSLVWDESHLIPPAHLLEMP